MTTAYAASVVSMIEPGCQVWSRARGTEGVGEDGTQLAPIGGTVIGTEATVDPETAEVTRAFRVATTGRRLRFHHLTEAEVDPASLTPYSTNALEKVVLAMADQVARNEKGGRKSRLTLPEDAGLVADMKRLTALVVGT